MGFRLANINNRASLVVGENYYDVEQISSGAVPSDPMLALGQIEKLAELYAVLTSGAESSSPTGNVNDVMLGPPVPRDGPSRSVDLMSGSRPPWTNAPAVRLGNQPLGLVNRRSP